MVAIAAERGHLATVMLLVAAGALLDATNGAGPNLDDAECFADELRVGDVPLLVGDTMVLHYDFGDDWRFQVTLESIDETSSAKTKTPKVTAESGESPVQYNHDDW